MRGQERFSSGLRSESLLPSTVVYALLNIVMATYLYLWGPPPSFVLESSPPSFGETVGAAAARASFGEAAVVWEPQERELPQDKQTGNEYR